MPYEQWQKDILEMAYDFDEEGRELINFARGLHKAVRETDQDTCLALVAAFLERLAGRKANDA